MIDKIELEGTIGTEEHIKRIQNKQGEIIDELNRLSKKIGL